MARKVKISDLVLRDAHQSLHATRMTTADMLPACSMLDKIGYNSLEAWGGATFDSCIRFLNEDPWARLRSLKKALPTTPIMMLLRGQNLLGYRHYADDVVDKFVEAAAKNGVGVFRIFDALNDPRNLKRAADAAKKTGKHVQMAISFATTPYHTNAKYADLAKSYAEFGADSICIKDMAGLLKPYDAYELVKAIKAKVDIPVQIHTHSTTGMSVATLVKAAEAGADVLDTVISSMSMGTSHSPTETVVEMLHGTEMDTGLDIKALLEIAAYFREVRKHYAKFESSFLGADTRILVSQVPGGMLSNLESQLKEQGAADKIDEVLKEIPIVQKDCGYIPLVTPTSQIVGTQAVFNVLFGRYARLTAETRDLVTGKYGKTPAECNADLVKKALAENKMDAVVTQRPADLITNEFDKMADEAKANGGDGSVEDVLTYAMFPKVAPKFFKERANGPVKFEAPASGGASSSAGGSYVVNVNGVDYNVVSGPAGDSMSVNVNGAAYAVSFKAAGSAAAAPAAAAPASSGGATINAPVAGTLLKHVVPNGSNVKTGQTIIMIESMKMELEVKATADGPVHFAVQPGSQIAAGQQLATIGAGASVAAPAPVAAPVATAPAAPVVAAPTGGVAIPAPVAGTLLKHVAPAGSTVSVGQTIIMIESMKMELEIKATAAGSVHFLVAPGSQISAGQVLAEIK
jgi:oxaloacetate decarboxylase alpha subunit